MFKYWPQFTIFQQSLIHLKLILSKRVNIDLIVKILKVNVKEITKSNTMTNTISSWKNDLIPSPYVYPAAVVAIPCAFAGNFCAVCLQSGFSYHK